MEPDLLHAPAARTFTVADLMAEVRSGRVRIPGFQRNYRWEPEDVTNLFDSIYRGYPIGSLLLWQREAPHEVVQLGDLEIEAEATPSALWVVDGQQRITSLAGVLLSTGVGDDSRFALFFDLESKRFVRGRRTPPAHWLPLYRIGETRSLLRWLGELREKGGSDQATGTAEDVAARIRDYQIPAYIVETDREETLRTIFDRLNNFGKALKSAEIFQALHGGRHGQAPKDLRTLGAEVGSLGFGSFDDNSLLRVVLALRGPDVYREFRHEFSGDEDPSDTFRDASQAIEQMVSFLRSDAAIPHLRLLPYRYVVPVLARFFFFHPSPQPRSKVLLRRWLWRDALGSAKRASSVSLLRAAVRAVDDDEEGSLQRLIGQVASKPDEQGGLSARLNEARARANAALMASWSPRSVTNGRVLNLAEHLESDDAALPNITGVADWRSSLVDRMIHGPTASPLQVMLVDSPLRHADSVTFDEVLESHAIPAAGVEALEAGTLERFLSLRREELEHRLALAASGVAEWRASDRPTLGSLVVPDEAEEAGDD